MSDPDGIDVRLAWSETGDASLTPVEAVPDEAASAIQARPHDDEIPDGLDEFEAKRERDAAIEAALDAMAEEPVSVVGRQVRDIRRGLTAKALPDPGKLVDEVERYLTRTAAKMRAQPPIDHEGMQKARDEMLGALDLYLEVCTLLRRLAERCDDATAALCVQLESEAARGLLRARDLLVSSHPG